MRFEKHPFIALIVSFAASVGIALAAYHFADRPKPKTVQIPYITNEEPATIEPEPTPPAIAPSQLEWGPMGHPVKVTPRSKPKGRPVVKTKPRPRAKAAPVRPFVSGSL